MREEDELDENTPSVCMLSKGCNSNILGTVWAVKLQLTGLFGRDVELTKTKYLHPNSAASTDTTATVTIITTSITKLLQLKLTLLQLVLLLLLLLLLLKLRILVAWL